MDQETKNLYYTEGLLKLTQMLHMFTVGSLDGDSKEAERTYEYLQFRLNTWKPPINHYDTKVLDLVVTACFEYESSIGVPHERM